MASILLGLSRYRPHLRKREVMNRKRSFFMLNSMRISALSGSLLTNVALLPTSIQAQTSLRTIIVDNAQDSMDGSCADGFSGRCNLRAALNEAAKDERSMVRMKVDSLLELGAMRISPRPRSTSLTIIRSFDERQRHIRGNGFSRLFEISAGAEVSLSGLSISGFVASSGGAITNGGKLVLEDSTFFGNRAVCFSSGAMTAFAACAGGAISNSGHVILGEGTRFVKNEVVAAASTASFTDAKAKGGALYSTGSVTFAGLVAFEGNRASAEAHSGFHPMPHGGAIASAGGGAVHSLNGTMNFAPPSQGRCVFSNNAAESNATTPYGNADADGRGGAIFVEGDSFPISAEACVFEGNSANEDQDFTFVASDR